MSFEDYHRYHMAIRHLRAREMMDDVSVASFVWKKKNDQQKYLNSLNRDIYSEQDVGQMTTVDVFNKLRVSRGE